MKIKELTLNRLKHHSFSELYKTFLSVYNKLFLIDELTDEDINKIRNYSAQKKCIELNFFLDRVFVSFFQFP